jgi:predicted dehydrogenase
VTVRLAIVGIGVHGERYARHLAAGDVPGATLTALCRRDRAKGEDQARRFNARFVARSDEIFADPAVDAVVFAVPCDLHPDLVTRALGAGKPVLVEKPLAPDAAGARGIVEAARRAGVPAMVAQTLRYNAVVRAVRKRRNDLGAIRTVTLSQRFEPSGREWLDDPAAGGILRNTGVHSFDLLRHLTGREAEEVVCFAGSFATRRTEDGFGAVIRLAGGAIAVVDGVRATGCRNGRIELAGETGQLVGDHVHHQLAEIRGNALRSLELPRPVPTVRECLRSFAAAVRGEAPVEIPLEEGLRAVEIVEACRGSCAAGGAPRRVARASC